MKSKRTVVTGMGFVTPFGGTESSLWEGLYSKNSAVSPLAGKYDFLQDIATYGAACTSFTGSIDDYGELDKEIKRNIRKGAKIMCRETEMAVASAQKAIHDAGLHFENEPQKRVGLMLGCDYMLSPPEATYSAFRACMDENGCLHPEELGTKGLPMVTPLWLLVWLSNMPACHISIYNQFLGPNNSITTSEASANSTLKYAHETIARDWADIMITGATGTRLQSIRAWQVGISEILADKNLPPEEASRPFDKGHTGQVLGEGAGVLVLESLEHALERGANIHAEYLSACDTMAGGHSSDLSRNNLVPNYRLAFKNALIKALDEAGKTPDEIGFIHAHGLGVPEVDRAEAEAIREVFASRSTPIPVVAAKSAFGNLGAGGSAVELVAGILALQRGVLFPTRNFVEPDDGCDLNVVVDMDTPAGDCFINLSTNFQGQTSAAIIGKYRD
ncbi:MAG: beta-ketoacyl synthase N-terminal-like domain-containing protein [Planctomycetia bacterium]|nr:beta-ketoacyl synthase N-terminal-like domain-containing protein [Planctomycetia bacterium]